MALFQRLQKVQACAGVAGVPAAAPVDPGTIGLKVSSHRTADEVHRRFRPAFLEAAQQWSGHHKIAHLAGTQHHDAWGVAQGFTGVTLHEENGGRLRLP